MVSTRLAKKLLSDGRNARLIVEKPDFWRRQFVDRFLIADWQERGDEIVGVFIPQKGKES